MCARRSSTVCNLVEERRLAVLRVGGAYATGVGARWGVGALDCLWGVGRRTTGVAAQGGATAGEFKRGEGRRGDSTRTGGVATLLCWVPVMAWD